MTSITKGWTKMTLCSDNSLSQLAITWQASFTAFLQLFCCCCCCLFFPAHHSLPLLIALRLKRLSKLSFYKAWEGQFLHLCCTLPFPSLPCPAGEAPSGSSTGRETPFVDKCLGQAAAQHLSGHYHASQHVTLLYSVPKGIVFDRSEQLLCI